MTAVQFRGRWLQPWPRHNLLGLWRSDSQHASVPEIIWAARQEGIPALSLSLSLARRSLSVRLCPLPARGLDEVLVGSGASLRLPYYEFIHAHMSPPSFSSFPKSLARLPSVILKFLHPPLHSFVSIIPLSLALLPPSWFLCLPLSIHTCFQISSSVRPSVTQLLVSLLLRSFGLFPLK